MIGNVKAATCVALLFVACACSSNGLGDGSGDMGVAGSGADECTIDASYKPSVDATDFVARIDNPYWPLTPGTTWVFGGAEYVEVTVLEDTKTILDISAVVVRDTVKDGSADGDVVEDTYDWYAQDKDGNVWYLGEDTKEYERGRVVSTAGSWQAGVDGARPGIVMHAEQPPVGEPYRQEYLPCVAEDYAEVAATGESVSVPFGDYANCVKTREFTPLEPDVNELKTYCAGVGLVLEEDIATGDRVELTDMTGP